MRLELPARGRATRVLLVRHAEPDEAVAGCCHGALDVPLSPAGRARAERLAAALAEEQPAAVYSSPLRRALETAEAVAAPAGLAPEPDPGLREVDFGALEGRTYEEIAAAEPELYRTWMETPHAVTFPGGESFADLRARVLASGAELRARHEGERLVLVTHGGPIRALLADALGLAGDAIFRLDVGYGGVSVVDSFGEAPLVRVINVRF